MTLRKNKYTHGPCPSCDGRTAKHMANGKFRCLSVGCGHEFGGAKHRAKPMNRVNKTRSKKAKAENFGALAELVHTLTCCVIGCGKRGYDLQAHHVVSRGAGGTAWMPDESGRLVGNIVPLCLAHHGEVHSVGRSTFDEDCQLFVARLRSGDEFEETLAELAVRIGEYAIKAGGIDPLTNERTKR